jgi:hypothetical protein
MPNNNFVPVNMRTGFNQDVETDKANDEMENLAVLFTIFAEESMRLAVLYCKHSNRTVTATEDFARAFKVRAFHGTEFWTLPHVQEKIEEVRNMIQESVLDEGMDPDEMDSEDQGDFLGLDVVADEDMEPYSTSKCTCMVCRYMNTINQKWPSWQPQNTNDIILKGAIDQKF